MVISTGKPDWKQHITDEEDSLAAALSQVMPSLPTEKQSPGLFSSTYSKRILNLCSQWKPSFVSREDDRETVLVFPDYKCISEVSRSRQGALELWQSALDPSSVGRRGRTHVKSHLKTRVIPYASVILLCKHLMASHVL